MATTPTANISLAPEYRFVTGRVAPGDRHSADNVVRAAVPLPQRANDLDAPLRPRVENCRAAQRNLKRDVALINGGKGRAHG